MAGIIDRFLPARRAVDVHIDQVRILPENGGAGRRACPHDPRHRHAAVHLTIAGYRDLKRRADAAADAWQVRLSPPDDVALPILAIRSGVIGDTALGDADCVSARLVRPLRVDGATLRQRTAVADGIGARDGVAMAGRAGVCVFAGHHRKNERDGPCGSPALFYQPSAPDNLAEHVPRVVARHRTPARPGNGQRGQKQAWVKAG